MNNETNVLALQPLNTGHARNGKVARLPAEVREKINLMLLDGFTYKKIIAALGPAGKGLNEVNLSHWHAGGFQDWLREHFRFQVLQLRNEAAQHSLADQDATAINGVLLQALASNLLDLLHDFDARPLALALQEHPDKYSRLLNAAARISDAALKCQRQRITDLERLEKLRLTKNPQEKKGLTDEGLKRIEEILGHM